jgi:RNA polymerase sigma-70 factor (ECF subfamily)
MDRDDGVDEVTRLALAAQAGDPWCVGEFIRAAQRDVRRYLAFHAGAGDADDLTQETFLRVLGALPRFQGNSSARTWVLSIARRVFVDHLRRSAARPRTVGSDNWEGLAEDQLHRGPATAAFTELVEIDMLLAALPGDRREALLLTQVLGFSYAEAAQVCGCPVGTIRSRVARARDDLVRANGQQWPERRATSTSA